MHVAAGNPEDFTPRMWPWLKVLIGNRSFQTHNQQLNLPEVGGQVQKLWQRTEDIFLRAKDI
jgi:hypothetical protein